MNSNNFNDGINKNYNLNEDYNVAFGILKSNSLNERKLFKYKVKEKQLFLIAGNLADIYKTGIPITIALTLVRESLPDRVYQQSLGKVLSSINEGKSLSQGFSEFKDLYPEFFIGIISIGENTGKLYEVLKGISVFYDKLIIIKSEIINACIYPLFIIVSMIMLCIFMINNVVPNFCEIYKSMNIKLPASCQYLYDLNNSFKNDPSGMSVTLI